MFAHQFSAPNQNCFEYTKSNSFYLFFQSISYLRKFVLSKNNKDAVLNVNLTQSKSTTGLFLYIKQQTLSPYYKSITKY